MKILLDYVFPISIIEPTPQASTAFLRQAALVCKPKSGQEGNVGQAFECSSMTAVAVRTDNTEAEQLFNAGMSKVFILLSNDLDLAAALTNYQNQFFTLLISSDFNDADIETGEQVTTVGVKAQVQIQDILYRAKAAGVAANSYDVDYTDGKEDGSAEVTGFSSGHLVVDIEYGVTTAETIADAVNAYFEENDDGIEAIVDDNDDDDPQDDPDGPISLAGGIDEVTDDGDGLDVGTFNGVVGIATDDDEFAAEQAAIANRVAFFKKSANGAKNMLYAFGKMLSNVLNWTNQQFIQMPFNDDVSLLGDANSLFDDKISFVINDDEFSTRLALFAAGGKAIIAPYVKRNLQIDLQSAAVSYISGNQPSYTRTHAGLLEDELQKVVQSYIDRGWISDGTVEVKLEQQNFVASGYINIAEPSAMWRIFGEMRQTL